MQGLTTYNQNDPKKKIYLKKAKKAFLQNDFKESFRLYKMAFWIDPNDLDSKIGLLLSDIAEHFSMQAIGFFDLYLSTLKSHPRRLKPKIQEMILHFIEAFDNRVNSILSNDMSNVFLIPNANVIMYEDVKAMLKQTSFVDVFVSIIFSTHIAFSKKQDFYEFLRLLVDNGFIEECMGYVDSLLVNGYDRDLNNLLSYISQKQS